MNFENFCQRARINAVVSGQAHYVTSVNGHFEVTTEPKYTEHIRYTAYPNSPYPIQQFQQD